MGGGFGFLFSSVFGLVLIAAWVILAGSRFVQGGVVERPDRVPQLYGYTASLIGLLWSLTSVVSVVEHSMNLTAPDLTRNEWAYDQPSVTSFEAYRATFDRAQRFGMPEAGRATKVDSIPEPELRRRYEALRADRILQTSSRAKRGIVTSLLGLILGAGILGFHWRWLRRRGLDLNAKPST